MQPDLEQQQGQGRSSVSANPESDFLDTVARKAYPAVKKHNPDISLVQIRERAEEFRGAKIRDFIPTFLIRGFTENSLPSTTTEITATTPLSEVGSDATHPFSSFLQRLQRPLQALGIKF